MGNNGIFLKKVQLIAYNYQEFDFCEDNLSWITLLEFYCQIYVLSLYPHTR